MGVNIDSLDTPVTEAEQAWLDSLSEEEKEVPVVEATDDEISNVTDDIAGNVFVDGDGEEAIEEDDTTATEKTAEELAAETATIIDDKPAPAIVNELPEGETLEALGDELVLVNASLEEAKTKIDTLSAALTEKMTKLEELAEALDDGVIGDGKYNLEKVKLESEIAKLNTAIDKATDAKADSEVKAADLNKKVEVAENHQAKQVEALQKAWIDDTASFLTLPENAIFAKDPEAEKAIADMVGVIHRRAVAKGVTLSNADVLNQARAAARVIYPDIPEPTAKSAVTKKDVPIKPKHKPEPPVTLGGVNKAVDNDTSGQDPLERIDRAPREARNKAYRDMNPKERASYLGLN
jgi:chromosome segregation ATPase